MLNRLAANRRVWMAEGAELVDVVLEDVGVDGPDAESETLRVDFQLIPIVRLVPRYVQGDGGRDAGVAMHLRRRTAEIIAQLRVSDEGQEGLTAFLQKRPAAWDQEE